MMKLTEILTERVTDIVYRLIPITTALRDLKSNEFKLTPVFHDNNQDHFFMKNRLFYLSFGRTKSSGFTLLKKTEPRVIYVLDGRKLSQKYKGITVNYDYDDTFAPDPEDRENEDRIISNKPIIPNAVSYIKEIHVAVIISKTEEDHIVALESMAKSKNIPIYFYIDDYRSFNILNKNKASTSYKSIDTVDVDDLDLFDSNPVDITILNSLLKYYEDQKPSRIRNKLEADLKSISKSGMNYNIDAYDSILEQLTIEANTFRRNSNYTKLLTKFSKYMKQEKTTIKQFIYIIAKKFAEKYKR